MAPNSRIILTRHAQAEHNVDLDYSSKFIQNFDVSQPMQTPDSTLQYTMLP